MFYARSTTRNEKFYQEALFPECETPEEMFALFQGKTVLDLGSGLNHWNPYSLINQMARRRIGTCIGIEPKIGDHEHFPKFRVKEIINTQMHTIATHAWRLLTMQNIHLSLPGKRNVQRADIGRIPQEDDSVDYCLASYLMTPLHISDNTMLQGLRECHRVLKPGQGELRMYPVPEWEGKKRLESSPHIQEFTHKHFEVMELPVRHAWLVPSWLRDLALSLRKK